MQYAFKSATFFYGSRPIALEGVIAMVPAFAVVTPETLDLDLLNEHLAFRSGHTLTADDFAKRGSLKATDPLIDYFSAKMFTPPMLVYHGNGFSVAWLAIPDDAVAEAA